MSKKRSSKKRKKKTVLKKSVFKQKHCSLKNSHKSDTCLDDRLLIKIGNILNQYEKSNIIIENSRKRIHKQISDKLSEMSQCNSEKCWLTIQEIISRLSPEELKLFKDSFKPKKPSEWDKDPNTWLTTSQLKLILEQLEQKYSNFKEYGALPMDFEKRNQSGCISGDLCNIDLQQHFREKKHNIGVVFNLDDHDEPGSHWTAMYVELLPRCREKPSAYYFDSVGSKPPKEIKALVDKLQDQHQSIKGTQLDFLYNDIQHQKENTECGIYALHFLETMLKGMDFEKYIENKNSDKYMENFRNYYFIDE